MLIDLYFASIARGRKSSRATARRMLEDLADGLKGESDLQAGELEPGRRIPLPTRRRRPR